MSMAPWLFLRHSSRPRKKERNKQARFIVGLSDQMHTLFVCQFFSEPGDPSLEKKEPAAKLTKLVKTEESKADKAKKQTTQPQK